MKQKFFMELPKNTFLKNMFENLLKIENKISTFLR